MPHDDNHRDNATEHLPGIDPSFVSNGVAGEAGISDDDDDDDDDEKEEEEKEADDDNSVGVEGS